uniref:Uncharacterized protein n=1 Tax=viral metagenome TaxID=1070528 RepID=A0A6C0CRF6_9ZZZZ
MNVIYSYRDITPQSVLLQQLLGYYTYGTDKLNDKTSYTVGKEQWYQSSFDTAFQMILLSLFASPHIIHTLSCQQMYNIIRSSSHNFNFRDQCLQNSVYLMEITDMWHIVPFLLFLESTHYYIDLKRRFGLLKPFYVSFMWMMTSVVLPSVLNTHTYDILLTKTPWYPFLLILAMSNIMDTLDIKEDRNQDYFTMPVMYGKFVSYTCSCFYLLGYVALFLM